MSQLPRHRRAWIIAAALLSLGTAAWQNANHLHLPEVAPDQEHHGESASHHSHSGEDPETCELCLQFSRLPAPPGLSLPPLRHDFAQRIAAAPPSRTLRTEQIAHAHRARGPPAAIVTVA